MKLRTYYLVDAKGKSFKLNRGQVPEVNATLIQGEKLYRKPPKK
jgi:hypothetical protein